MVSDFRVRLASLLGARQLFCKAANRRASIGEGR